MSKFTNLIVSGCSFMAYPWEWDSFERSSYDSRKDPGRDKQYLAKTYNFSTIISEKLFIPQLNLAYASNSNTNAIRRVTDSIVGHNLTNSLVFIGLTQLSRHDIPTLKPKVYATLKVTSANNLKNIDTVSETTPEDIQEYSKLWHRLNYNENVLINELLLSLDLLNGIILNRGGRLVVWNNLLETDTIQNRDYFFKQDGKLFNWPKFISARDKDYVYGQHPNSDDHKELSRRLISKYINNDLI